MATDEVVVVWLRESGLLGVSGEAGHGWGGQG